MARVPGVPIRSDFHGGNIGIKNIDTGGEFLRRGGAALARGIEKTQRAITVHKRKIQRTKMMNDVANLMNELRSKRIENSKIRGQEATGMTDAESENLAQKAGEFTELAGDDEEMKALYTEAFTKVTQSHLDTTSKHEVRESDVARRDAEISIAQSFQGEIATADIGDIDTVINNASGAAKTLEVENAALAKFTATEGVKTAFKNWSRVNPDLTQNIYNDPKVQKKLINILGAEEFNKLQPIIDQGRAIQHQNEQMAFQKIRVARENQIETDMVGTFRTWADGNLTAEHVADLDVPFNYLQSAQSLLDKATKNALPSHKEDLKDYARLEDLAMSAVVSGGSASQATNEIIAATDHTITKGSAKNLINIVNLRRSARTPYTVDATSTINKMQEQMLFDGDNSRRNAMLAAQAKRDVLKMIYKKDFKPQEITDYMARVLAPPKERGAFSRMVNRVFNKDTSSITFENLGVNQTLPYADDTSIDLVDWLLKDQGKMTQSYNTLTYESAKRALQYINTKGFQEYYKQKEGTK